MVVLRCVHLLRLGCAAVLYAASPSQEADTKAFRTPFVEMLIPSNAIVNAREALDSNELREFLISIPGQSYDLTVSEYLLGVPSSARAAARRGFLADSMQSEQNDWGIPGRVRRDTVGGLQAWGYEPTCGDCSMYRVYLARGKMLVVLEEPLSENDRIAARQRDLCRRILATFRWHGA
jgi:hypothetical protein